MKNIIYIILFISTIATFTSCQNEVIMFDDSKNHVAFLGDVSIREEGNKVGIPVMVVAAKGSPAITVNFTAGGEVSGIPAGENDYKILNSSNELSFPDGWGFDTIWVEPVDNNEFTGDKQLMISLESNSLNYDFGANQSTIVTIVDNEHPLKNWLGTYSVDAKSYGDPGNWDEAWTVVTTPDPDDPNNLFFTGFGTNGDNPVLVTFDLEAMTITIPAGSDAGDCYGYGSTLLYVGTEDLVVIKTENIVGTIDNDGSIHIDKIGFELTGANAGYVWDVFDSYWTLNKSASINDGESKLNATKAERLVK